jgi:hypothetical protein
MTSDRAVLLLDFLRQHRVLPPAQLREPDTDAALRNASRSGLVNELANRKWLTPYQASPGEGLQYRPARLGADAAWMPPMA